MDLNGLVWSGMDGDGFLQIWGISMDWWGFGYINKVLEGLVWIGMNWYEFV